MNQESTRESMGTQEYPRELRLSYAKLSSHHISSAQLGSAQLDAARLSSPKLRSAHPSSPQLDAARLSSAFPSSANLRAALIQLSSAQLSSNHFGSARRNSARWRQTKLDWRHVPTRALQKFTCNHSSSRTEPSIKTPATGEAQERTPDKLPNYRNFNLAGPFANEDCEWPISFMISLTEL